MTDLTVGGALPRNISGAPSTALPPSASGPVDRGRAPRIADQPDAMGHRCASLWCGRFALLPYVMRKGLAFERLGWIGLAAIVIGGGAPVLLANAGLLFAPAAHAGALFPGRHAAGGGAAGCGYPA